MKKALFAVATLGFVINMNAQKSLPFSNGLKVENHAIDFSKKTETYKKLLSKSPLHKISKTEQASNFGNGSFDPKSFKSTPSGTITAADWQQLVNVNDGSNLLIKEDFTYEGNPSVSIGVLNPDTSVKKEFTIEIPATANLYDIQSEVSNFNFNGNTKTKFLMFIHYFEGGMGPEFQKNAVWMIDEDGAILNKFEDTSFVKFVKNSDGTTNLFTYNDDETTMKLAVYNQSLEPISAKEYLSDLFLFFSGSPVSVINVDGQQKIVVARYEKLFMDNATLEVTPENHLVLEIFNQNLGLEKQVNIPLPAYEQDSYIFGLAEFGVFYGDNKYEITKNVFNADEKLEFLYSISYQDLMQDKSWTNYFVANDEGNTLKSMESTVVDLISMKEIAGQEDQMSFILEDEEGNQSIKMFDIPSWQTVKEFPAEYNGDLLSSYYNRIPNAGTYQYLMGLGEPVLEGNNYFGVINKYTPAGELSGSVKLNIGEEPLRFSPLLFDDILEPSVFDSDAAMEYNYVYSFKYPGNAKVFNSFNVAKETGSLIFTVNGDETKGDVFGSGFLVDNNNKPYKLGVVYGDMSDQTKTTEFFDIPFEFLATSNVSKNNIKSYTDKARQIVGFTEKLAAYKVYNMLGTLVSKGNNAKEISTSSWVKGMYLVQYITENNTTGVAKVMIQ